MSQVPTSIGKHQSIAMSHCEWRSRSRSLPSSRSLHGNHLWGGCMTLYSTYYDNGLRQCLLWLWLGSWTWERIRPCVSRSAGRGRYRVRRRPAAAPGEQPPCETASRGTMGTRWGGGQRIRRLKMLRSEPHPAHWMLQVIDVENVFYVFI